MPPQELYDEYGEPRERTDGGKKSKWKRGKLLPHTVAAQAKCVHAVVRICGLKPNNPSFKTLKS